MKLDDINVICYMKAFGRNAFPSIYFKFLYKKIRAYEALCDINELDQRLAYYIKVKDYCKVPKAAVSVKNFKKTKGTFYYLDLKEFLHYFKPNISFAYHFGDETHINTYPTLFKARPIHGDNVNSVLFKLNKRRHFKWVNDKLQFSDKKDILVWRGKAKHPLRTNFVKKFWNHPLCNIGQIKKNHSNEPWMKEFLQLSRF